MEIENLLNKGCFVAIDKPRGPPSAQVGTWVKEILGAKKNGHIGTLDPKVSGVLLVGINKAIKFSKYLSKQDKEYVAIMHLHKNVPKSEIRKAIRTFVGKIKQKPPLRSAVAKRIRERTIYRIDILDIKGKDVLMRIKCEAGTYIRKLIHDIGRKLKVGANMLELRRTKSGQISEKEIISLYDLKDAYWLWKEKGHGEYLSKILIQPRELLEKILKKIVIKDSVLPSFAHGAPIYRRGVVKVDEDLKRGDYAIVYSESGTFCGTVKIDDGPELYAKIDVNWIADEREKMKKTWKK